MSSDNSPFASPGPLSRHSDSVTLKPDVQNAISSKLSATIVGTARLELKGQVEKRIQDLQRQRGRAQQEVTRIEREIAKLSVELNQITQPSNPMSRMCCVM